MKNFNLIREGARLLTVAAIALGIGGAAQHPDVTMAKAVSAPSTGQFHVCTIAEIGSFSSHAYVICQNAAPGGINYFMYPTVGPSADTKGAARFLNIALTAKALGNNVRFAYDDANNATSVPAGTGCDAAICRQPIFIAINSGV